MSDDNEFGRPRIWVRRGEVVRAEYIDPQVPRYQGNPLVEALPPILDDEEVVRRLRCYPAYKKSQRDQPKHLRLHLVEEALRFFAPMPIHEDLEQRFSRMLRGGYIARNPATTWFVSDLHKRVAAVDVRGDGSSYFRSTATGFTILGISGIGKTTSVERILSLYPQIILHSRYGNKNFSFIQLVWLMLECPHDGSTRGLCVNFFQAMDDLLGTRYYEQYASGRQTVDDLIPQMARVASLHGLGVLVIDEIQFLSAAKSGGARKMLNFFVQLINTIGIPVVLIGTYQAYSILTGQFRQIRRGTGQGDLVWDRMQEDEDWTIFTESLWGYQYTKKACPLTPELSHALYEETQGITDFAAKIYMLAQIRAISRGEEAITVEGIQKVAPEYLRTAQRVLSALRRGAFDELYDVEDVKPPDFSTFAASLVQGWGTKGSRVTEIATNTEPAAAAAPPVAINEGVEATSSSPAKPRPKSRSKRKSAEDKNAAFGLPSVVASASASSVAPHEALQQAGFIRHSDEFFPRAAQM